MELGTKVHTVAKHGIVVIKNEVYFQLSFEFRVQKFEFRVENFEYRVENFEFRV